MKIYAAYHCFLPTTINRHSLNYFVAKIIVVVVVVSVVVVVVVVELGCCSFRILAKIS